LQPEPALPLRRRAALALFGLFALPLPGSPARAAEVRLGRKVAQAIGAETARGLARTLGPGVAALDAQALQARCATDFRAGHTLIVGGALVARTEAVRWLLAAGYDRA
jgi:hypothetical protein